MISKVRLVVPKQKRTNDYLIPFGNIGLIIFSIPVFQQLFLWGLGIKNVGITGTDNGFHNGPDTVLISFTCGTNEEHGSNFLANL